MKTFSIGIKWNHKGRKYPRSETVVVEASSYHVAAYRALKQVKKVNQSTWGEPVGSSIRVDLYITDNGKEKSDGRRGRVQHETEQESGVGGDA